MSRPDPSVDEVDTSPRAVRVAEVEQLSADVRGLKLVDPRGVPLAPWAPGAHIDLYLPSGLIRNYSLCGDPDDLSCYSIGVLREPCSRGGSEEVHTRLQVGDELKVRGPRNRFPLVPATGYIFVAGGVGITPMLPMLAEATSMGVPWKLIYGGRTRNSMAFLDKLNELRAGGADIEVLPQDEVGLIDIKGLIHPGEGERVYTCGPSGLLEAVAAHCAAIGVEDRYHFERFTASSPVQVGADESAQPFEVQLGESGPVLEVPADRSILSVVLDAGIDVAFSCEEGECGSCETQVLSGEPDHRDDLLTDDERARGSMLICVSRSRCPRLVIDVTPI